MKKIKHKEVTETIKVIRDSFHDSVLVYKYGGCYGFYKILKHLYPTATAYFDDEYKDHILVKIGDKFYDIKGEWDFDLDNIKKLTKKEHERWSVVSDGQRIEMMVAKHQRNVNRIAKEDN